MLAYRMWRKQVIRAAPALALLALAVYGEILPPDAALLVAAGGVAVLSHAVLHLLGAALGNLRPMAIEVGAGQTIAHIASPRRFLIVRWLPIRWRVGWSPSGSVRLGRLRMALPYALPVAVFATTLITLSFAPAVADWIDPEWHAIARAASALALVAILLNLGLPSELTGTVDALTYLSRVDAATFSASHRHTTDPRLRAADRRLIAALHTGDVTLIRHCYDELMCFDPPRDEATKCAAAVAYAVGDIPMMLHAARAVLEGCAAEDQLSDVTFFVLFARETGHAIDADVMELTRRMPQILFDHGASAEGILRAGAAVATINGEVETAIAWGEAALRLETGPENRAEIMLLLAESYAARGRAREAKTMLTRAHRRNPYSPRLPFVTRIVADHLAHDHVALTL